jgi:hypothetical protein
MSIVPDLRQAIAESPDGVAHFVDPVTGERFVAMREDSHERLRQVLDCEVASGELVDAAMQDDDQDDPSLEAYQHFRRPQ